jgi:AcrR family transcriptional regulator
MSDVRPVRKRAERSDVRDNRERILVAAEVYFGEQGIDASLHELARRAGVGVATLYRRFPTHSDLIRALYLRFAARLDGLAVAVERTETGWEGIVLFIDGTIELILQSPSITEVTRRMGQIDPGYRAGDRWVERMSTLVQRAHDEGSLHPDIVGTDVATIPVIIAGGLAHLTEPSRSILLARQRAIVLNGLRNHTDAPLLPAATRVDTEDFHNSVHGLVP